MNKQIGVTMAPPAVSLSSFTFTLKFPGGEIAILEVRGASDLNEGRAVACEVLPRCRYEVLDGDVTNGQAEIFYAWSCASAQECQPRPQYCGQQEEGGAA